MGMRGSGTYCVVARGSLLVFDTASLDASVATTIIFGLNKINLVFDNASLDFSHHYNNLD